MIYESGIWKKDLEKELKEIKDFFANTDLNYDQAFEESDGLDIEEQDMLDVAFIKLQKFSIYSSIIIRKLIEAHKISDELLGRNFPVQLFKKVVEDKVTFYNGYEIEKLYDIEIPHKSNISIKDLTDRFIHSFHFMPKYDWQKIDADLSDDDTENWEVNDLLGIYFSSDKTKNKFLSFIKYKDYLKIIDNVITDFIVHVEYVNGEIIKKSSKIND